MTHSGRGLHTGEPALATVRPAAPGAGIRFRRTDAEVDIPALPRYAGESGWGTVLSRDGVKIRTVEHVLAALHGAGIDNALVEVTGPEVPALDGSAFQWISQINRVGVREEPGAVPSVALGRTVQVASGDSRYWALPVSLSGRKGLRLTASIDFSHPHIGTQFACTEVTPGEFAREIAPARTFGLLEWREELAASGLGLGVDLGNTVVFGPDGPLTDERGAAGGLRFSDEPVRHKLLDLVGDLALVGARLQAHIVADKPGHRGNVELARRLRRAMTGEPEMAMDIGQVMRALPHRYPMLLVDRVLGMEAGKRIAALKNVTINEPFFRGHFPDHPIMPGVLIIEALAQCCGLLLMEGIDKPEDHVVYFVSVDGVKFRRPVVPGDQLYLEAELIQGRGTRGKLRAVATVEGRVVAEATIVGQIRKK